MPILKIRAGDDKIISKEDAEKIAKILSMPKKARPEYVNIGEDLYKTDTLTGITQEARGDVQRNVKQLDYQEDKINRAKLESLSPERKATHDYQRFQVLWRCYKNTETVPDNIRIEFLSRARKFFEQYDKRTVVSGNVFKDLLMPVSNYTNQEFKSLFIGRIVETLLVACEANDLNMSKQYDY